MKKHIVSGFFACLVTLVALSSHAQGAILNSILTPGLNAINDVNRERLIKGANNNDPLNAFILEEGDTLEAVLLFDNIDNANGTSLISDFPGLPGLTVYSRITVATKVAVPGFGFAYTFTSGFGDGVTVAEVYEGSTLNEVGDFNSGGVAGNIADATDGTLLFTLILGADDFWNALGTDNLLLVSTGNPVNFNFGLSVGINPGLVPIVTDGVLGAFGDMHDVRGSGQVFNIANPTQMNGWDAASNTQVEFLAAPVPEPASMLVWSGLSIVGFGLAAARKRRLAAKTA